ncbi:unnamed protein product [Mesocestoides corti]|uniref:Uncharacterized protein n=1 Tax=Mesocestoides corti TaxID=53468 RepID=A0A0R3UJ18_MESCO|nr:unnamed protein product [Mesocestoides corti]
MWTRPMLQPDAGIREAFATRSVDIPCSAESDVRTLPRRSLGNPKKKIPLTLDFKLVSLGLRLPKPQLTQ